MVLGTHYANGDSAIHPGAHLSQRSITKSVNVFESLSLFLSLSIPFSVPSPLLSKNDPFSSTLDPKNVLLFKLDITRADRVGSERRLEKEALSNSNPSGRWANVWEGGILRVLESGKKQERPRNHGITVDIG